MKVPWEIWLWTIGPLVSDKKIEGFLPYRNGEQTFIPLAHEGSMSNLALTGSVVSEEKTFEDIYSRTSMARTSLGPWEFVRGMGSSSH